MRLLFGVVGAALVTTALTGCQVQERICSEGEVPVYGLRGEGLYCLDEDDEVPAGWEVVTVDGVVPVYVDEPGYRRWMDTTWKALVEQHAEETPTIPSELSTGR